MVLETPESLVAWLNCIVLSAAAKSAILTSATCLENVRVASDDDLIAVTSDWSPDDRTSFFGAVASLRYFGGLFEENVVTVETELAMLELKEVGLRKTIDELQATMKELQASAVTKEEIEKFKTDVLRVSAYRRCSYELHMKQFCQAQIHQLVTQQHLQRITHEARIDGGQHRKRRRVEGRTRVSDEAWAKGSAGKLLPVQRPKFVHLIKGKWSYNNRRAGICQRYDTIHAVYDAAINYDTVIHHQASALVQNDDETDGGDDDDDDGIQAAASMDELSSSKHHRQEEPGSNNS